MVFCLRLVLLRLLLLFFFFFHFSSSFFSVLNGDRMWLAVLLAASVGALNITQRFSQGANAQGAPFAVAVVIPDGQSSFRYRFCKQLLFLKAHVLSHLVLRVLQLLSAWNGLLPADSVWTKLSGC